MKEILMSLVATPLLLLAWVGVQHAWQRSFNTDTNEDALAARDGCGSCGSGPGCGGCHASNNERR